MPSLLITGCFSGLGKSLARAELDALRAELEAWKDISASTDIADGNWQPAC